MREGGRTDMGGRRERERERGVADFLIFYTHDQNKNTYINTGDPFIPLSHIIWW